MPWAKPSVVINALLPEWTDGAACRDLEPEEADRLFFPERGHSATAARALCRSCVVKAECLAFALKDEDAFFAGVWGGRHHPKGAPRATA
ncbi:MAG: WhiB family transcriptional regulator [Actinomycetota bacterium]